MKLTKEVKRKRPMRSVSITELKARLSEYLRYVSTGEEVVVTERGRPVAVLGPTLGEVDDPRLAELVDRGLVRPGRGRVPDGFWDLERPRDAEGCVRSAVVEERAEGW